ncbi:hypothetical protein H4Q26_006875 [Puccinia striiformis f. sp. tritici PST-130]|nr:hypothetical protein Pst134EB_003586 [Puccinia striiformis f. sp. tritici]KAI9609886.1 hypothetical protein H4Q26_006875 [Puccinia striiformis f. sp. tritici PST-130]
MDSVPIQETKSKQATTTTTIKGLEQTGDAETEVDRTISQVEKRNQCYNYPQRASHNHFSGTLSDNIPSTSNQSFNLPTMSLPSLVSVPQILQLHHQTTSAAHKGFVKVQVSKKITSSNQSR